MHVGGCARVFQPIIVTSCHIQPTPCVFMLLFMQMTLTIITFECNCLFIRTTKVNQKLHCIFPLLWPQSAVLTSCIPSSPYIIYNNILVLLLKYRQTIKPTERVLQAVNKGRGFIWNRILAEHRSFFFPPHFFSFLYICGYRN